MRQESTRRDRNRSTKEELKKRSKALDRAVAAGDATKATEKYCCPS